MNDGGDDEEGGEASLMILKRRTDRPRLRTHRLSDHKHYADDGVGVDGDGEKMEA